MAGGIVLIASDDPLRIVALPVPRDLWLAVYTPGCEVPTATARAVLPKRVDLSAAVRQSARLAQLVHALHVGDLQMLGEAVVDTIVEPARAWFAVAVAEMKVLLYPVAHQHGSQTIRDIFEWYAQMGETVSADGYLLAVAERTRMTRQWSLFLEQYPLVLTPFLMRSLFHWNYDAQGFAQTKDLFDASIYSYGINYLGLPAGVVPVGLVDELPAGVQIVGRRFREDLILDALAAVEAHVGVLTKELWARE